MYNVYRNYNNQDFLYKICKTNTFLNRQLTNSPPPQNKKQILQKVLVDSDLEIEPWTPIIELRLTNSPLTKPLSIWWTCMRRYSDSRHSSIWICHCMIWISHGRNCTSCLVSTWDSLQ